jgi:hypothetical protein
MGSCSRTVCRATDTRFSKAVIEDAPEEYARQIAAWLKVGYRSV